MELPPRVPERDTALARLKKADMIVLLRHFERWSQDVLASRDDLDSMVRELQDELEDKTTELSNLEQEMDDKIQNAVLSAQDEMFSGELSEDVLESLRGQAADLLRSHGLDTALPEGASIQDIWRSVALQLHHCLNRDDPTDPPRVLDEEDVNEITQSAPASLAPQSTDRSTTSGLDTTRVRDPGPHAYSFADADTRWQNLRRLDLREASAIRSSLGETGGKGISKRKRRLLDGILRRGATGNDYPSTTRREVDSTAFAESSSSFSPDSDPSPRT